MQVLMRHTLSCLCLIFAAMFIQACQSGGGGFTSDISGDDRGSEPINETESIEYKKAIVRCYKTGGTRIVKIMGVLRCY